MIRSANHPKYTLVSFSVGGVFTAIVFMNGGVELTHGMAKVTNSPDKLKIYCLVDDDTASAEIRLGEFKLPIDHALFTELSMQPELEDYYLEETL